VKACCQLHETTRDGAGGGVIVYGFGRCYRADHARRGRSVTILMRGRQKATMPSSMVSV
jgi:hypothetical protein